MVLEADNKKAYKHQFIYFNSKLFFSIDHGIETYTNTENKVR